jgi:hypothetical protein
MEVKSIMSSKNKSYYGMPIAKTLLRNIPAEPRPIYDEINEFMEPIFMKKKKHDFKAWRQLRKVLKRMDTISPDFDTLYKIWQTVNAFHECFMHSYSDNSKLHLFLGTVKNYTDSYAMIYKESDFTIKFILQFKNGAKIINLEINRSPDSRNTQPETITFEDGTYEYKDTLDMEKFAFIISCIMDGTKELMKYYYKNKRF